MNAATFSLLAAFVVVLAAFPVLEERARRRQEREQARAARIHRAMMRSLEYRLRKGRPLPNPMLEAIAKAKERNAKRYPRVTDFPRKSER